MSDDDKTRQVNEYSNDREGCLHMGCWGVGIVVMLLLLGPIGWIGLVVLSVCGYKFLKS
jgi:hypothetical protein